MAAAAVNVPIKLDPLTANNRGIFNKIVSPPGSANVEATESHIKECQESGDLAKYAYFSEVPVGILVLKPVLNNNAPVALEISQMTVLESYATRYGVEDKFIEYSIQLCSKRHVNLCVCAVAQDDTNLVTLLQSHGFTASASNDLRSIKLPPNMILLVHTVKP